LIVSVQAEKVLSLDEIRAFLAASGEVAFAGVSREEVYGFVNQVLRRQRYQGLKRGGRGLVRRYLAKMTGLSRAQVTRLIGRYLEGEEVKPTPYRRHRFAPRYTREDVGLLAEVDEAHEGLSGPATHKLLQRAWYDFGERRFERLAELSVSHLYRIRKSAAYRRRRLAYQPTRPTVVSIGERRKPDPQGRPGYIRVDTVHQGDLDKVKGVYHINAVDEVTQWQVVGAVEGISEAWLLPVLKAVLAQFPFTIRGFHSDNGSEYINDDISMLLKDILVKQTKSRPRRSNDNALVECKNGAVVRKHMGYGHISLRHAPAIDAFYRDYLNPYLNFHRPCGVPELAADRKGKVKKRYLWYATPWEILRQLPDLARSLRPGVTRQDLERQARAQTDHQAAAQMQQAKRRLFAGLLRERSA
jgi:transposase InsO family protein